MHDSFLYVAHLNSLYDGPRSSFILSHQILLPVLRSQKLERGFQYAAAALALLGAAGEGRPLCGDGSFLAVVEYR